MENPKTIYDAVNHPQFDYFIVDIGEPQTHDVKTVSEVLAVCKFYPGASVYAVDKQGASVQVLVWT